MGSVMYVVSVESEPHNHHSVIIYGCVSCDVVSWQYIQSANHVSTSQGPVSLVLTVYTSYAPMDRRILLCYEILKRCKQCGRRHEC